MFRKAAGGFRSLFLLSRGEEISPSDIIFFAMLLLVGLRTDRAPAQVDRVQTGVASYYAQEFHGRVTSNGERFNMYSLTAAHQTLPYNTLVKVTNLDNNKSVVVRINDAGPFKDNRIIDLSKAAALKIGMVHPGTTMVRLEVLETDTTVGDFYRIDLKKVRRSGFMIQLGSFGEFPNAIAFLKRAKKDIGKEVLLQKRMVKGDEVYRVVTGAFPTREAAEAFCGKLRARGRKGMVFQIR